MQILPSISEEQAVIAQKALDRRQSADYQCFLLLQEAQRWLGVKPTPEDKDELKELQNRIEEVISERDNANEEFVNAILNR